MEGARGKAAILDRTFTSCPFHYPLLFKVQSVKVLRTFTSCPFHNPSIITRLFDESFAPIPIFDERFARQYRYELPPVFPLASPYTGIDHSFSGPTMYTLTQNDQKNPIRFILPRGHRAAIRMLSLSFRAWVFTPTHSHT
jgi:hypothetical protein